MRHFTKIAAMRFLFSLTLCLSLASSQGAYLQGCLQDMIGSRPPLSSLLFTPLSTPFAVGGSTVLDITRSVSITNGCINGSTNFVGGLYLVSFGGYSRNVKVLIPINDTNTYTFAYVALLATNVVYWAGTATNLSAYIGAMSYEGPVISITSYGAVPYNPPSFLSGNYVTNGSAVDNTTNIQIALAAAASSHGATNTVFFPQGVWRVTTNILVPPRLNLVGLGVLHGLNGYTTTTNPPFSVLWIDNTNSDGLVFTNTSLGPSHLRMLEICGSTNPIAPTKAASGYDYFSGPSSALAKRGLVLAVQNTNSFPYGGSFFGDQFEVTGFKIGVWYEGFGSLFKEMFIAGCDRGFVTGGTGNAGDGTLLLEPQVGYRVGGTAYQLTLGYGITIDCAFDYGADKWITCTDCMCTVRGGNVEMAFSTNHALVESYGSGVFLNFDGVRIKCAPTNAVFWNHLDDNYPMHGTISGCRIEVNNYTNLDQPWLLEGPIWNNDVAVSGGTIGVAHLRGYPDSYTWPVGDGAIVAPWIYWPNNSMAMTLRNYARPRVMRSSLGDFMEVVLGLDMSNTNLARRRILLADPDTSANAYPSNNLTIGKVVISNNAYGTFIGDGSGLTNVGAAAIAVVSNLVVTVSSRGIVNGLAGVTNAGAQFGPDTAGTTTSGLQEAWNVGKMVSSNGPVVSGITLQLGSGYFYFTNALLFTNSFPASTHIQGDSLLSSRLVYAGSSAGISTVKITGGNTDDSTTMGHVFLRDLAFSAIKDSLTNVLLEVQGYAALNAEHLNFTGWRITTNATIGAGVSIPGGVLGTSLNNPLGLVGLYLNGGYDHGTVLNDIYLAGLAAGIYASCDHVSAQNIRSAFVGSAGHVLSGPPFTNAWPKGSVYSIGAAIIDATMLESFWSDLHLYDSFSGIFRTAGGSWALFDHVNFEGVLWPELSDGPGFVTRDLSLGSVAADLTPIYVSSPVGTHVTSTYIIQTNVIFDSQISYGADALPTIDPKVWYIRRGTNNLFWLNKNGSLNGPAWGLNVSSGSVKLFSAKDPSNFALSLSASGNATLSGSNGLASLNLTAAGQASLLNNPGCEIGAQADGRVFIYDASSSGIVLDGSGKASTGPLVSSASITATNFFGSGSGLSNLTSGSSSALTNNDTRNIVFTNLQTKTLTNTGVAKIGGSLYVGFATLTGSGSTTLSASNNLASVNLTALGQASLLNDAGCEIGAQADGRVFVYDASSSGIVLDGSGNVATGPLTTPSIAFLSGAVLTNVLMTNIVLDFPSTAAGATADLLVPFQFPKSNDFAIVSAPAASMQNNSGYSAWVSNSTVYVRFHNDQLVSAIDPVSGTFRVKVEQWK